MHGLTVCPSLKTGFIFTLIGVYILILLLGCYSVHSYMQFADLIERVRSQDSLKKLRELDEGMRKEAGQSSRLRAFRA